MLFLGVLFGLYTAAVVYALGSFLEERFPHEETPFYTAFFSSAGVEEAVKFLFLFFLIWGNRNFNEPLDGIVYGVFVSLGFAWAENVIYVTHPILGGYETALERALLSVPGHGLFGVRMGYYFALGKYRNRKRYLPLAFFSPYLAHALYNYFLLKREPVFWLFFFGFRGAALGFRVKKNQRAAKLLAVSGKSIKRVLAEGENLLEIP